MYHSDRRCRPYQAIPTGSARKTTVKTNSAASSSSETAPLRATAIPTCVKNATAARTIVSHQSVFGSERMNAII